MFPVEKDRSRSGPDLSAVSGRRYLTLGVGKYYHPGGNSAGGAPGDLAHPAGPGTPPMADRDMSWTPVRPSRNAPNPQPRLLPPAQHPLILLVVPHPRRPPTPNHSSPAACSLSSSTSLRLPRHHTGRPLFPQPLPLSCQTLDSSSDRVSGWLAVVRRPVRTGRFSSQISASTKPSAPTTTTALSPHKPALNILLHSALTTLHSQAFPYVARPPRHNHRSTDGSRALTPLYGRWGKFHGGAFGPFGNFEYLNPDEEPCRLDNPQSGDYCNPPVRT